MVEGKKGAFIKQNLMFRDIGKNLICMRFRMYFCLLNLRGTLNILYRAQFFGKLIFFFFFQENLDA